MIAVIFAAVVVLFDQITKLLAIEYLSDESCEVIEGILRFRFVKNEGAAFGMLSDNRAVFMIASVAIIALLSYVIYKYHGQSKLFDICLGLILGGGIGNMIDRIRLEYVVDFIDFYPFDFWVWVFNIADSAVVIGCFLAIICFCIEQKNGKKFIFDGKEQKTADVGEKSDITVDNDEQ